MSSFSCAREIILVTFCLLQIKAAESPITRIFGGKFRSVLRASGQKDSVIVEDWRSLRLDIQVCQFLSKHKGREVDRCLA